jgi:UDP-N-acetylglucosamine:LPS N-acetylglucosamine transferase
MEKNRVILGVTKTTALIFDEEFPGLKKIQVEPYAISYSKILPMPLKLLLDSGRILRVIKKEREQLREIIKTHGIEVVISDNRFGLSNPAVESVYITHQLNIQAGLFSGLANKIHKRYLKRFNRIWVPDHEGDQSLAGKLSAKGSLKNITYVGPLSRLKPQEHVKPFDVLCLLSGPEPQRTLLENNLLKNLPGGKEVVMVRGAKNAPDRVVPANIKMIDLPNAKELSQLIQAAHTVVCRSGYSTLMDLHALQKKKLVLIPTPGQSEQVYLAAYWKKKFGAEVAGQDNLGRLSF